MRLYAHCKTGEDVCSIEVPETMTVIVNGTQLYPYLELEEVKK